MKIKNKDNIFANFLFIIKKISGKERYFIPPPMIKKIALNNLSFFLIKKYIAKTEKLKASKSL